MHPGPRGPHPLSPSDKIDNSSTCEWRGQAWPTSSRVWKARARWGTLEGERRIKETIIQRKASCCCRHLKTRRPKNHIIRTSGIHPKTTWFDWWSLLFRPFFLTRREEKEKKKKRPCIFFIKLQRKNLIPCAQRKQGSFLFPKWRTPPFPNQAYFSIHLWSLIYMDQWLTYIANDSELVL